MICSSVIRETFLLTKRSFCDTNFVLGMVIMWKNTEIDWYARFKRNGTDPKGLPRSGPASELYNCNQLEAFGINSRRASSKTFWMSLALLSLITFWAWREKETGFPHRIYASEERTDPLPCCLICVTRTG